MERPDVPEFLSECKLKGAGIDLDDVTYYIGAETIVPAEDGKGLPRWQEAIFAAMSRSAARASATIWRCPATRWSRSAGRSKSVRLGPARRVAWPQRLPRVERTV